MGIFWRHRRLAADSQIEGSFSPERYRVMARLLDEDDFDFLQAHPGYRKEIGAKLRSGRRQIFRMYLRDLSADFRRLHSEARAMLANCPDHRGELVEMLIVQQLTFWRAMAQMQLRLAGIGRADVMKLIEAMARMQSDLARLAAPATA
ncbi:MAG: hypothetical protein ACRD30_04705 [Bryobacteraceae bacterium]